MTSLDNLWLQSCVVPRESLKSIIFAARVFGSYERYLKHCNAPAVGRYRSGGSRLTKVTVCRLRSGVAWSPEKFEARGRKLASPLRHLLNLLEWYCHALSRKYLVSRLSRGTRNPMIECSWFLLIFRARTLTLKLTQRTRRMSTCQLKLMPRQAIVPSFVATCMAHSARQKGGRMSTLQPSLIWGSCRDRHQLAFSDMLKEYHGQRPWRRLHSRGAEVKPRLVRGSYARALRIDMRRSPGARPR